MSHFTVLVIGDNVADQMEPFWELDMSASEASKDSRASFTLEYTKEQAQKEMDKYREDNKKTGNNPKFDSLTLDGFMKEYFNYIWDEDEKGYGSWWNRDGHWDWYVIGGRWAGYFKLKDGMIGELGEKSPFSSKVIPKGYADVAKKGDIDWEGMKLEAFYKADDNWKKYLAKKEELSKADEKFSGYWEFGINAEDTKEQYMKRACSLYTFAVVKDGEWYEKGSMGWFGVSSNDKEDDVWIDEWQKLVESLPENTTLTVVDAHI